MSRRTLALTLGGALLVGGAVVLIVRMTADPAAAKQPVSEPVARSRAPLSTASADPDRVAPSLPTEAEPATDRAAAPAPTAPQLRPEIAAKAHDLVGVTAATRVHPRLAPDTKWPDDPEVLKTARERALEVLRKAPNDVNSIRGVVATSCAMGDAKTASKYSTRLQPGDKADLERQCMTYGVELPGTVASDPKFTHGEVKPPGPPKTRQPSTP